MRPQLEPIIPLENNSFKAFIKTKKKLDYPFHYHPEYELIYILSSSGIRYVGSQYEDFYENDLVLLGPNVPHCWRSADNNPSLASALVVQWNGDLLGDGWLNKKEFSAIGHLLQLSEKGIKFPLGKAKDVKPQLIELVEETSAFDKMMKLVYLLNGLSGSGNYDLICNEEYSREAEFRDNERLNIVFNYLKKHYREKITLAQMSSLVYMTEESFSRFFSKLQKKSFFSFLNEYRVGVACQLLIQTDQPIVQICYHAGYESESFFYRQFKRFTRSTPQHYRNQFKLVEGSSIPAD